MQTKGWVGEDGGLHTKRLAGVAQRAAWPIGRDRSRQCGPIAPVLAIEVLDHLLAALMLEVDVDVGRLAMDVKSIDHLSEKRAGRCRSAPAT